MNCHASVSVDQAAPASPRAMTFLWAALSALMIAFSVAQQIRLGLNPDSSWLITVAERVLGGDRLYVDVFELNPPASVLITLPWLALAGLFDLRPEAAVTGGMVALAVVGNGLFVRTLRVAKLIEWRHVGPLVVTLLFVTLPMVGNNFAQREHLALIACLPWLAVMAARAQGGRIDRPTIWLAGIGMGLTAMVKPHFLLVAVLPLLAVAWRRRDWSRMFLPEAWIAGAMVLAYGLATRLLTPEFWTLAIPLVRDGYLQDRQPLWLSLGSQNSLMALAGAALTLTLARGRLAGSLALMPLLGAAAFAVAVIVQSKGFSNHQYPMLALSLVALALAIGVSPAPRRERVLGLLLGIALAGNATLLASRMYLYPEVAALVRSEAPPRPTMIMAGSNLTMAHPLSRWVDGRWVGTRASLWATHAARQLMAETRDPRRRARLAAHIAEDRRIWLDDVRRHRPDVILVPDGEGRALLGDDADLQAALRPYRAAGAAQGITVLVRTRR